MTFAFFLTIDAAGDAATDFRDHVERRAVPRIFERTEANFISLFSPDQADDPYVDDASPPALVVQIDADDLATLTSSILELDLPDPTMANCEVFESISYPIDGVGEPALRTAPLSYNVRYYAPVDDDQGFVEFYLAHHPQILVELPGIKNVFCYVPVSLAEPIGIPVSNCILGNEVVFDTVAAFNEAMASDVRHRLRQDYHAFPVRPGPNTHYAMQRRDFNRD